MKLKDWIKKTVGFELCPYFFFIWALLVVEAAVLVWLILRGS